MVWVAEINYVGSVLTFSSRYKYILQINFNFNWRSPIIFGKFVPKSIGYIHLKVNAKFEVNIADGSALLFRHLNISKLTF